MTKQEKAIKRAQRWRKAHPGRERELNKRSKLRRKFGISLETYEKMFKAQRGCCAICKKPERTKGRSLAVDHDHGTGEVRGLLCGRCNPGIGLFDDQPLLLAAAIRYLSK